MIYVISKSTFGSYNVRDIQCNANWDCCPYSDYALIPDSLVDGVLATKGYCDIVLTEDGGAVASFTAKEIPSVPEECCGENTVLSVNGVKANPDGDVTLTAADVQVTRANLLDNWYFANPVNQRGQTAYTVGSTEDATCTIDRWYLYNADFDVSTGILTSKGGFGQIGQLIENHEAIIGKTVTMSALLEDVSSGWYFRYGTDSETRTVPYGSKQTLVSFTYTANSINRFANFFSHEPGAAMKIVAMKLELGTEQTLAHEENGIWVLNEIPNYGEELAKCKRYLQVYRPPTLSGQTVHSPIGVGVADSENFLEIDIPLSVPLRNGVLPSVLYSGNICAWDGQTERTATDFRVIGVSDADLRVVCSTSGATARGIYTLAVLKSNMDGYFMINAEL